MATTTTSDEEIHAVATNQLLPLVVSAHEHPLKHEHNAGPLFVLNRRVSVEADDEDSLMSDS